MLGAPTTCRDAVPDPVHEVEGRVSLLQIDRLGADGATASLGLDATYPVHGTSVPNTNRFFEADLWGFAARRLEADLGGGSAFVAGVANGAEGDVRPTADPSGWDEARRVGELLASRGFPRPIRPQAPIDSSWSAPTSNGRLARSHGRVRASLAEARSRRPSDQATTSRKIFV